MKADFAALKTVGPWLAEFTNLLLPIDDMPISQTGRTDNVMDVTVELKERVLTSVLATARSVFGRELAADVDPIAAGFDSIAALQLAAVLEEELGVDCTLEDVFDASSFAALAGVLAQRIDTASDW